jgi:hypothetical protein
MSRQIKECLFQVLYNNGQDRVLESFTLKVFNMNIFCEPIKSDDIEARDGTIYPSIRGYRLIADLQLDSSLQAESFRDIAAYLSNDTDYLFHTTTAENDGLPGTILEIDSMVPEANDVPNQMRVDVNGDNSIVLDYVSATNTVTLSQSSIWSVGDPVNFYISQNLPRYVNFSHDTDTANYVKCIVDSITYGYDRSFTINKQKISLRLKSVSMLSAPPSFLNVL